MTTDKLNRAPTGPVRKTPITRKEIVEALSERLDQMRSVTRLPPPAFGAPKGRATPDFFFLDRKTLNITRVIGEASFQPHEITTKRTLSVSCAIFVLERMEDTTPAQDEWLAFARSAGVQCHIARTWAEVEYALEEIDAI